MALPKPLSTSCLEVIVQGIQAGQTVMNVYHYQGVQPVSGDTLSYDLLDFLTAFQQTIWIADVIPLLSASYKVERYIARELDGNGYKNPNDPTTPVVVTVRQFVQIEGGEDDTGDVVGDFLPTFNSMSYYMQTGLNGRHGAGHTRIGALPKSYVDATPEGNRLTAAAWAAFNAIKTDFVDRPVDPGVGGDTAVPCLFWRAAVLDQVVPTIDDMRPYMKLYNVGTTRRLITSQVSRKQKNRGGL